MINLANIKNRSALGILETYAGVNPYLLKLKNDYLKHNKVILTENQSAYVIENYNREPVYINRIVNISSYLGEQLQTQNKLNYIPEKILIEFILAETEKTYHIYGKISKNQAKSEMYFIPKTQVIDDPYFEQINIDVDFTKYNEALAKYDKKLYEHQEQAVKFLLTRNGGILADLMGMGKTISTIVAALESGAKKILVVCPSSVKINWKREINVFDTDTCIVEGKKWCDAKFTIINFDILKNFHSVTNKKTIGNEDDIINKLKNSNFDLIIVDESHYLSNNSSIRGKIVTDLVVNYNIPRAWLLTGTPITNRPMDFYNLLKIIKSPIANNWKYYTLRYCDGKHFFKTLKNGVRKQIWLTNGASNLEELASKTKNIILRRSKEDTLDMPEKTITPVYHTLSSKSLVKYDELWEEYLNKKIIEGKPTVNLEKDLVELILLRQFIALEAIPHSIEIAENAIEEGRKVIIFTNFTEELDYIKNHFGKLAVGHNGKMTERQKQKSVDEFQNNPNIKVFVGNIESAGVGITLTEATVTIFNSYSWVPGKNQQAEDRSWRIGQKNDVNIYYQIFENTISTRMWDMLNSKIDIISTIIGDKKQENYDKN